ncbi:MAG: AAA family ATPase [Dehalococcoidaceae bacterium]|nr:AAA family ATPase [Dehalococcoidaceae bacterium]
MISSHNVEVIEALDSITYIFKDLNVKVLAERITDDIRAELTFFSANGSGENTLLTTEANLLSTPTQTQIAKRLQNTVTDIKDNWLDVLTYVAVTTKEIKRKEEPAVEIWPCIDDSLEVEYLISPLLYKNHPTVFFGDYSSGKSLIALILCYILQLPYTDNPLGLNASKPGRCLYLDYEDDESSFQKRWSALEHGFGQGAQPLLRRRMTVPLADQLPSIKNLIEKHNVELLVIDSLGPAARGNLNDPEPAIRYHAALRELGITSLTLAHCAKEFMGKKRSIFGSVFFTNLARAVWEIKAEAEPGINDILISVKHTKANLSGLHPTLGYRLTFSNNTIAISSANLAGSGLSGELSLSEQIKSLLVACPLSTQEIADKLGANEGSTRTTLNRMVKKGVVYKAGEKWGLQQ